MVRHSEVVRAKGEDEGRTDEDKHTNALFARDSDQLSHTTLQKLALTHVYILISQYDQKQVFLDRTLVKQIWWVTNNPLIEAECQRAGSLPLYYYKDQLLHHGKPLVHSPTLKQWPIQTSLWTVEES